MAPHETISVNGRLFEGGRRPPGAVFGRFDCRRDLQVRPPDGARRSPSTFSLSRRAFSLIEVMAAVGIFAFGMVAVIALFAPVAKSTAQIPEAETATQVAALLQAKLQSEVPALRLADPATPPLVTLGARFKIAVSATRHQLTDADNAANSNAGDPRLDTQLIFASRDGSKIGAYADPIWGGSDVDKFFEIALIRNETLSPPTHTVTAEDGTETTVNPDATALYLAYSARIRWPAFVPDTTAGNRRGALPFGFNQTGTPRFDHSQKQVLFATGTIMK